MLTAGSLPGPVLNLGSLAVFSLAMRIQEALLLLLLSWLHQVFYTSLFGIYSNFLLIRTGVVLEIVMYMRFQGCWVVLTPCLV